MNEKEYEIRELKRLNQAQKWINFLVDVGVDKNEVKEIAKKVEEIYKMEE